MIARIWHGAVPVEKSEAYLEKMRTVAQPHLKVNPAGCAGYAMHQTAML